MNPYGTPTSASGSWPPPAWAQQLAAGHAAPGQASTGSAAPGHPLSGQPPFDQAGSGQPAPVPPAPEEPRRGGRLRIGVAGLLAGALIGGGAGAGVVALTDGADGAGSSGASTSTVRNVTITNPETATAVTAAAAKAAPSVVTVYVASASGSGSGSGVILSEDGYVLTNSHVVSLDGGGQATVSVRTADGTLYDATIVGAQPVYDLAVLKLESASDLVPAEFADSDEVRVGDLAVAIGAPLGLSDTVTDGIISAKGRAVATGSPEGDATVIDALQTDAAINPGNSGGALVNGAGEVIGINTAIATVAAGAPGEQARSGSIGVGFAIPGNTAARIAQELVADGSADITYLGVSAQTAAADGNAGIGTGAQLVQVQPGTPAADAELQAGDVITAVGDRVVTTSTELTAAVRSAAPGDDVTFTVRRGQGTEQVEVTLGATEG
ncbi:PDZ domain-containing protein [Geodermatophilus sp. DF01-2]|uniref:S1C family serine protease n=1 Tax=Geodermatophilus sp. DF01-2 TaxID=2559610 RepID=UPI001073D448|nr:trypsin-like peptidase domain-containing protein [Geodermatophilus sp. DF01_2]TFV61831.1 PDZ domain-containing protein [Geodermatophilus sp. DF01_2]